MRTNDEYCYGCVNRDNGIISGTLLCIKKGAILSLYGTESIGCMSFKAERQNKYIGPWACLGILAFCVLSWSGVIWAIWFLIHMR